MASNQPKDAVLRPRSIQGISEISFPKESIVGVINHHGHLSIARGNSQLSHEDTVLVFAKNKALTKLRKLFSKP